VIGLANYLANTFMSKIMGANESQYHLHEVRPCANPKVHFHGEASTSYTTLICDRFHIA
jgi:hypothetical protein